MKPKNSYQKGLFAEMIAAWFLRIKGYRIITPRYKTPFGEIDLLARKGRALICVEVKYRPSLDEGLCAVSPRAQKRIIAAAQFFRSHHPAYTDYDVRFDIITLTPSFFIRHHKNAWYDS